MKWYLRATIWLLPYVIAIGVFTGLFWLGALVISHLYGMSVTDAFIDIVKTGLYLK